jgi:hypothetical protein
VISNPAYRTAVGTGTPKQLIHVIKLCVALLVPSLSALSQTTVVSSYSQNFDSLGTGLPTGWGVWTSSSSTGNGTVGTFSTTTAANNASVATAGNFRNMVGASQTWSSGLSSGTDRAIGWRASTVATRTGSITFTLSNTTGWTFDAMSFQLFTPNSTGAIGTYQLQYQIGASGTFSQLGNSTYSNNTAQNPLIVTSISLTSVELASLNNQSGQVTLRFVNTDTSTSAYQTLAIDNFSYSASAIPEPSTYAAIFGSLAFAGTIWHRRRQRKAV